MPSSVLVVEDDECIRELLATVVDEEGHRVLTASNGAEALALVQAHPASLILLDMRMPVMTGWQFAEAYRHLPGQHAPIVVLTAAADGQHWAHEINAEGVLPKPFELAQLVALLRRFLPAA